MGSPPQASPFLGGVIAPQGPIQDNVISVIPRQQQVLSAITSCDWAVLHYCAIFRMLGRSSPLATPALLFEQYAEGRICRVPSICTAPPRGLCRRKFELLG